MDEVIQQKMLPTIRSYLKLYTTLPLNKLATFMCSSTRPEENWDLEKEVAGLSIHLLCFKHKMKNIVWTKGASGLDGKFQSGSEVIKIPTVYNFKIQKSQLHKLIRCYFSISVGLLHRSRHGPHRRHEGSTSLRWLFHPKNFEICRFKPQIASYSNLIVLWFSIYAFFPLR